MDRYFVQRWTKDRAKSHGYVLTPLVDLVDFDPLAIADLFRVEAKRAFGATSIDPYKFPTSLRTRRLLENTRQVHRSVQADFLAQLADGSSIVVFTTIDVSGTGTHPLAGSAILGHRAALQIELPLLVEYKNMNRAVHEALAVYLSTRLSANHGVIRIDDIEKFIGNRHIQSCCV